MRRVAIALLLLLAAPAGAAASARPPVLARAVPAALTAARGGWRTPALAAPRRFELLGASWRGGRGRVELRVRGADGRWSAWRAAEAGDPVWSGAADAYQLRGARPLRGLRVRLVSVGRPALAPRAAPAAGLRPPIVPRAAWDPRNQCRPRTTPAYGRIDFALVHHTVSLNAYGPREAPAMVLAICLFHRDGNGWNDIGYDLLVDRFGTVYEGRAGGVGEPVVGAQAQGWNDRSTGIAAIGDFGSAPLPDVALHALARAIAWKLSLSGVPARGATAVETSTGGPLDRWRKGARVRFQRISGHRDAGLTECPGNALYAQLPALRALVARLMAAPRDLLTISPAPDAQPAGGPVLLTGRLARADGSRPAGAAVVLQQRLDGAWRDVAAVRTGADGVWSAGLALVRDGPVRALATDGAIASPTVPIVVRSGVRARVSARRVRLGGILELTGATDPPKARVRLDVERLGPAGAAGGARRVRVLAATAEGRFAATLRLPAPGLYRLTVRTRADALNAAGGSRPLTVRVLRRR